MWSGTARQFIILPVVLLLIGPVAAPVCGTWFRHARAESGGNPEAPSQPPSSPAGDRNGDRGAVRAVLDSFVKSFESRDAKALAAHWTLGGEYHSVDGVRVQGREALEKGFAAFFARSPEPRATIRHESLRFLSGDAAIEEGSVVVRRGPLEPNVAARYSALLVREGGRWFLGQLTESAGDEESIEDFGWLVGQWKSKSKDGTEIETTYSWLPNKKFLQVRFTIKEASSTLSGSQVMGVDPTTGAVHSWAFEADGGVGEGAWRRDGDHWLVETSGTTTDGRTLTETSILRRINDDTFTWQSVDRHLGDEPLPDLAPVKVMRVKP